MHRNWYGVWSLSTFFWRVNLIPSIKVTALLGTSLMFVCFSIAAMLWPSLAAGSSFESLLYLSLALTCGSVLYHTLLIIEQRRAGNEDFVEHALDLFMDFIGIFRKLLVILTQKEEQDRRRIRRYRE